MNPSHLDLGIFISHDWEDADLYERAVHLLEQEFPGAWRDLSVPRQKAIQIATSKRDAWSARAAAVANERRALETRKHQLIEDLERVGRLAGAAGPDAVLGALVLAQREDLDRLGKVLPNARARERYVSEPGAALAAVEQSLRARSLLDRTVADARRILQNEITAVESSMASVEHVLARIEDEHAQTQEEEPLLTLPAFELAFRKMPPHKTLVVDRLLAEQLSALVSQSDLVLLLVHDYGIYKSWIHFELTLAVRHRRPIIAMPARGRHESTPGLLKDLANFGAVVADWGELPAEIRQCVRAPIGNFGP